MLRWLRRSSAAGEQDTRESEAWSFDPRDPDFVRDPYPFFGRLRRSEPVHRTPAGPWLLTRYEDVAAALDDDRLGNAPARYAVVHERNRERYVCADVAANILPFMDPPGHSGPRLLIGRAFAEQLRVRPPDVSTIARTLLEPWRRGGTHHVLRDFASPLSVRLIADVLGTMPGDETRLERWSESFFYLFNAIPSHEVREELDQALTEFRAYLRPLVAERTARPRDDLVSRLAAQASGGGGLTEAQVVDNCMLLFADGLENVDRAIGNAIYALLEHPGELRKLRANPASMSAAVDECLRFESPAQYIGRIAGEDVDLSGVTISAGSAVLLALGSANRDPEAFERPDSLDIMRSPNPHLAFGRGRHSCIGGPLVELQMREALDCLLRAVPDMELVDERVSFAVRPGHRWVEDFSVKCRPPAG